MTGLSLATRVTATLSAATIFALGIAAHHAGQDISAGVYNDTQRALRQERLLSAIVPARQAAPIDWLSARVRRAACGLFESSFQTHRCAQRLLGLDDAMHTANAALRTLGPPARGKANHLLATVYAVDGERLLGLLEDGSATALSAARELKLMARIDERTAQPFAGIVWREHASGRTQEARFAGGSFARIESPSTTRANPWAPFSGCAYAQEAGPGYVDTHLLHHDGMPAHCMHAPRENVIVDGMSMPVGWPAIAPHLVAAANKGTVARPNSVTVYARPVAQGAHAVAGIVRREQSATQGVADCMTGSTSACTAMSIDPRAWQSRYEFAAVRRIGILIVDIATGEIEAAASAHTPCYTQHHDGPGTSAACPHLPGNPARRDAMLTNHALFAEAMPGSLVKPITAIALLADTAYASYLLGPGAQQLRKDIAESNSKAFHDRLFCSDTKFIHCTRPQRLSDAAAVLGWNEGCDSGGPQRCAVTNLVDGSAAPGGLPAFTARVGIREQGRADGAWEAIPAAFSPAWATACQREGWSKCKGGTGSAVDLLADVWGQGNARATPPGIARMLASLGTAANGDAWVGSPHLLHATLPALAAASDSNRRPVRIDRRHAQLVVSGMSLGHHKGGTSASACTTVASAHECNAIDWVAGKTATPVFNHDRLTLDQRRRVCGDVLQRRAQRAGDRELAFQCGAGPVKWYAALIKSTRAPGDRWDKSIVVITERNWDRATGLVDSPGDTGVNIAARAAFESILRLY
ncbi:MAG: hypothetical protein JWQ07_4086 [Ramlibacter sp.]|nr:hypothetical protein [Ramlibacter sp.]